MRDWREIRIGAVFGKLTVVGGPVFIPRGLSRIRAFLCLCACGTSKVIRYDHLGSTMSCGCQRRAMLASGVGRKHGFASTRLYAIWGGMIRRCHNQRHKSYPDYGAKGIAVCDEWRGDFLIFRAWAVEAGYTDALEIDRIDNALGYLPDNCRWVTEREQTINRSVARQIVAFGQTQCLADWVADPRCVVGRQTVVARLAIGWTPERAMTETSRTYRGRTD